MIKDCNASVEEVNGFLESLSERRHDRYYQTIELPHGKTIQGYERTENTWNILKDNIDFKNKTVLDVGCYHCYCAFRVKECGATNVTGVDYNKDAIDTATELTKFYNLDIELIHADVDEYILEDKYDIVICSNVAQVFKTPEETIKKIFDAGDLVVFEAHEKFKEIFDKQKNHKFIKQIDSARTHDLSRRIYFYESK